MPMCLKNMFLLCAALVIDTSLNFSPEINLIFHMKHSSKINDDELVIYVLFNII